MGSTDETALRKEKILSNVVSKRVTKTNYSRQQTTASLQKFVYTIDVQEVGSPSGSKEHVKLLSTFVQL